MSNRIINLFKNKNRNLISVYFTAGYPNLDSTCEIINELEIQGTDLIEIGIPFSDPMADGPIIQESGNRALENGMSLKLLFEQLADIRKQNDIPLIMMGYINPIIRYGFEEFCKKCAETGIDGMIIPDLPFADYISKYKAIVDKYNLSFIMLITPETSEERIRLIDNYTTGFIYMVSTASTTGAQKQYDEKTVDYFRRINALNLKNPRLVGFGISNKATLDAAHAYANGAIIGSRFISAINNTPDIPSAVSNLFECLKY